MTLDTRDLEELTPPSRIGRYELLRPLGQGGMASVHLARWRGTGNIERTVALKVMRPEVAACPEYRAMFREEARIAMRLRHQYLVDVQDIGEENGQLYMAMEYLEGVSVGDVLRARKTRTRAEDIAVIVRSFANFAEGLHAIHSGGDGGLVHRDISPQNMFILCDGSVRIADFGVALDPTKPALEERGVVKGKISYLAPEVLLGAQPTATGDLWALGVVLWEVLAGRKLFAGADARAVATKVVRETILPPSAFRPDVPPELDALVLRLLDRDWQARPRSGRQIALELAAILRRSGACAEPATISDWTRALVLGGLKDPTPTRTPRSRMTLPVVTITDAATLAANGVEALPIDVTTLAPPRRTPAPAVTPIPATASVPRFDAAPRPRRPASRIAVPAAIALAMSGMAAVALFVMS